MDLGNIYTITDAQNETGESRHLINYLLRDREIPIRQVGQSKVIDQSGLEKLRNAIKEFHSKPRPIAARI